MNHSALYDELRIKRRRIASRTHSRFTNFVRLRMKNLILNLVLAVVMFVRESSADVSAVGFKRLGNYCEC